MAHAQALLDRRIPASPVHRSQDSMVLPSIRSSKLKLDPSTCTAETRRITKTRSDPGPTCPICIPSRVCMLQKQQLPGPNRPSHCHRPRTHSRALHTRRQRLSPLRVQSKTSSPAKSEASAKTSVETGLKLFSDGQYKDALQYFESAMRAGPSDDEARAALYNAACAHAKLKQWQPATDAVKRAVNDYRLRLTVAIKVRTCILVLPHLI